MFLRINDLDHLEYQLNCLLSIHLLLFQACIDNYIRNLLPYVEVFFFEFLDFADEHQNLLFGKGLCADFFDKFLAYISKVDRCS